MAGKRLSPNAVTVLTMIAEGHSYEQILAAHPTLTLLDIFMAAREALDIATDGRGSTAGNLAAIRRQHPRAYESWTADEEDRLTELVGAGTTPEEIALVLQRQAGAIRSRMVRLGLAR
jgi:DNA-binding CsgD family transcriptional regulator